jgi:hypothetical protein
VDKASPPAFSLDVQPGSCGPPASATLTASQGHRHRRSCTVPDTVTNMASVQHTTHELPDRAHTHLCHVQLQASLYEVLD